MTVSTRQPTIYISHGGGPCFWITFPPPFGPNAFGGLRTYLEGMLTRLPARPRAIVLVSAHWEERLPTVSTAAAPSMLFDYYGFPEETYHLSYPAPGSPELAAQLRELLTDAGITHSTDNVRGFDHGVFVPMLIVDPAANIPVVMLSLRHDLDPAAHIALGRALAPLRDDNVLIIGSGSSYHNLRAVMDGDTPPSAAFDTWLTQTVTDTDVERRNAGLIAWRKAPAARICHPREEHLLPLMVAAGAGGNDVGKRDFHGMIGGKVYSGYAFG